LLGRVARHPDLTGTFALAATGLEAAAAARLGDSAARDAAIARLDAAVASVAPSSDDASLAAAAIRTARATPVRPAEKPSRSPLDPVDRADRPDETWRAIWSIDLDRTLFRRLFEGPFAASTGRAIDLARSNASWMTALPVVAAGRIYVNDGESVRAIDADSRNELWSRTLGVGGLGRAEPGAAGSAAELSTIAVDDAALVTFEGHASTSGRVGNPRVWCLDPVDGQVLWSLNLEELATSADAAEALPPDGVRLDLSGLFPTGRPLLLPDLVVIAARKPTQRLEQIDWLLGLDRRSGRLRWATSIAGASGTRLLGGRRLGGIAEGLDAVFVATPLGVVARVRPDDGAIEWLRRVPVPMRDAATPAEPWEMGGPVVAGGRVIALDPGESEIVALDVDTGAPVEIRPIGPGTQWETPRYLIAADLADGTPVVLGVGSSVVAFDARDLSQRRWSLADALGEAGVTRAGSANRAGIRGRVSVAGGQVLVPGIDDLVVADLASGSVRARLTGQKPANALLLEDRIVAASDDALRVLMPVGRAEEILRARLDASPDDPAAAMALLELADDSGQPALAIESARAARRAFDRGFGTASLREQFVDRLVRLAAKGDEPREEPRQDP